MNLLTLATELSTRRQRVSFIFFTLATVLSMAMNDCDEKEHVSVFQSSTLFSDHNYNAGFSYGFFKHFLSPSQA